MKIVEITKKEYKTFRKKVYQGDTLFKDNKTALVELVVGKKSVFAQNSIQKMVGVKNKEGEILCAGVLIIHKNAKNILYIAFFEALSHQEEEVSSFFQYSREYGREHLCDTMILGIDGHVNFSFGFSTMEKAPTFGECYSPLYYLNYFRKELDFQEVKAVTHVSKVEYLLEATTKDVARFQLRGLEKCEICEADFSPLKFRQTIEKLTHFSNEIFAQDPFYVKREAAEDFQLFRAMYPLLSGNNLLFAKYQGKEIGFFFWYPDFNELVKEGSTANFGTFLRYKGLKQCPNTAKVVEMGVKPDYLSKLPILYLLHEAAIVSNNLCQRVEGGWILDTNEKSKKMTSRYMDVGEKEYVVYVCQL